MSDSRRQHPAGRGVARPLRAVPNPPENVDPENVDGEDGTDSGGLSRTHSSITATEISFVGWLTPLAIDRKTSSLKVTFMIAPDNPITHRDFITLMERRLEVTIRATRRDGENVNGHVVADPRVDPVRDAIQTQRANRAIDSWVTSVRTGERATSAGEKWWL